MPICDACVLVTSRGEWRISISRRGLYINGWNEPVFSYVCDVSSCQLQFRLLDNYKQCAYTRCLCSSHGYNSSYAVAYCRIRGTTTMYKWGYHHELSGFLRLFFLRTTRWMKNLDGSNSRHALLKISHEYIIMCNAALKPSNMVSCNTPLSKHRSVRDN